MFWLLEIERRQKVLQDTTTMVSITEMVIVRCSSKPIRKYQMVVDTYLDKFQNRIVG